MPDSFRIIPNKEQEELINKNISCVQPLLAQSKNNKYLLYFKFAEQIPELKQEYKPKALRLKIIRSNYPNLAG